MNAALITSGYPDSSTLQALNQFIEKFERKHAKNLEEFHGNISFFKDASKLIDDIFLKKWTP